MKKGILQLALLLVICYLLIISLRLIFQIPRPATTGDYLIPFSFPSLTILLHTVFWGFLFVKTRQSWALLLGAVAIIYISYQKFITLQHSWQDLLAGFLLGVLIIYLFKIFYKQKQIWSRLAIDERFPDPLTPLFGELITETYTQAALKAQRKLGLLSRAFIPEYRIFKGYLYNNFFKSRLPQFKILKLFFNLYCQTNDLDEKYSQKVIPNHQRLIEKVKERLADETLTNQLQLFKEIKEKFIQRMVYESMASYLIELVAFRFKLILFFLSPKRIRENYDVLSFDLNNDSKIFIEKLEELVELKKEDGSEFNRSFNSFIKQYGYRFINYDFINPTWEEKPQIILDIIENYIKENIYPQSQLLRKFKAQSQLLKKFNSRFSLSFYYKLFKKQFYRWQKMTIKYHLLKKKRYNSRMEYFYYLKKVALNIGQNLQRQGIIKQANDIFFLWFNEVEELIKSPHQVNNLISQRKNEWQQSFKLQAKFKISNEKDLVQSITQVKEIKELRGLSVSQGRAVGKCKIILNQEQFINFAEGDILVTKTTNPAWTPLFTIASGVITETGGILSHAAIVSREYNLPCLVGVKNVTNILKNGMMVEVDANKGFIKIL